MSETFGLHGFTFDTEDERQRIAEGHDLWPAFVEYWNRTIADGKPLMSDLETREQFEFFIEGAYSEFRNFPKNNP